MKKNFLKLSLFATAVMSLALVGCQKNSKPAPYEIHRFANNPYLAEVWWGEDYDPAAACEYLNNKYNQPTMGGACSSWHKDNFHGRNIDWNMRDFATIIIHMPKSDKVKHASVSLLAGNPVATLPFLDENKVIPEKYRNILAASVVDGINDCGVAINHNIVPYEGNDYEKNGDLASVMVCRYVLDNCSTARDAVDSLRSKRVTQAVVVLAHDYSHFFISDSTVSYVVEWINGEFTATEFKSDGQGNFISANNETAIMTNYFVGLAEKYGLGTNDFYKNHRMAAGVERQQIIDSMLPNTHTVDDHLNICKAVWYRQFCQGKTNWATENSSNYGYDATTSKAYWFYPDTTNMHLMDTDDVYTAAKALLASDEFSAYFDDFNKNNDAITPTNSYWFTQHSVVYDLKACKGYIIMQEGLNSPEVIEVGVE